MATDASTEYGYDVQNNASADRSPDRSAEESLSADYDLQIDQEFATSDEAESENKNASSESDESDESDESTSEKPLSSSDWAEYGLTESDAKQLDGKGELVNVLRLMDARFAAIGKATLGKTVKGDPTLSRDNKPAPVEKSSESTQASEELKLDLDPEYFDEAYVKQFTGVISYVNRQSSMLSKQQAAIESLQKQLADVMDSAHAERMDAWFGTLGEDYTDVFGKGPLDALPSDSPQRKRRLELDEVMTALAAGYESLGHSVPPMATLRDRALRMVASEKSQEVAKKRGLEQARNTMGQFVARPTQRQGKPLTRDERAEQFAENFYKKKGM